MSAPFDPYHAWLGILPEEQPPNHYRLLGIALYESDPQVIQRAAESRIVQLSGHRLGQWSAVAQRMLNELATAKVSLLQPETKSEYDANLRQRLASGALEFALSADSSDELPIPPAAIAPPATKLPPVIPPPVSSVPAPGVIPPPIVDPAGRLDRPQSPIAAPPVVVGMAAAHAHASSHRTPLAKGVLLVVLVSAAAAFGGAVFLSVVLRKIDESHDLASAATATAGIESPDDVATGEATDNDPPDGAIAPDKVNDAAQAAKQRPSPDETKVDPDAGDDEMDAPADDDAMPAPGDADAGAKPAIPEQPLVYREEGMILHVAISPDGHEAVSVARLGRPAIPNSVRFWSMEDGTQVAHDLKLPPDVTAACYSASGNELLIGTASGKISILALATGEALAIGRGAGPVNATVATGNGAFLFLRPNQLAIEGWDRGQNVLRVACEPLSIAPSGLAISADCATLLTGNLTAGVPDLNVPKKNPEKKAPDAKPADRQAVDRRAADSPRIGGAAALQLWAIQPAASAGGAANERVYRATLKLDLTKHVASLSSLALTADGRRILFADSAGVIHVWNSDGKAEARQLAGHTAAVSSMAISADGARLVSGSEDRSVRVWALGDGIELMRYDSHTQAVRSVAITADGRIAISGGDDGQLRIWRLPAPTGAKEPAPPPRARVARAGIFEPAAAAGAVKPVAEKPRVPVRPPTGAAGQRATAEVKKLFRLEFAGAKDPQNKLELAVTLLNESKNYPLPYRFAMLDESRNLAASSGNLEHSQRAIQALAEQFEVDTAQLNAETMEQLLHQPLWAEIRQQLAAVSLTSAEEALAAEKFAAARRLLAVATAAARKGTDARLTQQITERAAEALELQKVHDRFTAGQKTLSTQPDDAAAHLAVGKFLCFVRQDWVAGLPHLVDGDNAGLQEVARQELAGASEPPDQVALADAWWKLAQAAKGKDRADFFARSRHWYESALPKLTGLTETRVAQRLDELDTQEVARPRGR
jgi:WD40 repeat protein